jgi:hypothetical protein
VRPTFQLSEELIRRRSDWTDADVSRLSGPFDNASIPMFDNQRPTFLLWAIPALVWEGGQDRQSPQIFIAE